MKGKSFSKRLYEVRTKLAKSQQEMADLLGIKLRMYSAYETGEFDSSPGDARRAKHLQKLEQMEIEYEATLKKLENLEYPQTGNVAETVIDLQRQIDELTGKLNRVLNRLGMN